MPELPEVECIRLSLAQKMLGARILGVVLHRADMLDGVMGTSRPDALLKGQQIVEFKRHGKQLALCTNSGRALIIRLGMSGQLFLTHDNDRASKHTHVHAVWRWQKKTRSGQLFFRDPRRFGGLQALPDRDELTAHFAQLGPDALTITRFQLAAALKGAHGPRRSPIKSLLLDQQRLAGVGNIYADEALFRAKIAPMRESGKLSAQDARTLATSIRAILSDAIQSGGSTIRDYVNGSGASGAFQQRHQVYGRAGEPCVRCNAVLKSTAIAQRTTVWCPACQPVVVE